ncbi:hypothetical protein [Sphingobium sp. MK2]|uniref:hypothetical protein n=1 Tax=Sphingobium sp. MK2 TaxID=3116540 RepID=UPI0032E36831
MGIDHSLRHDGPLFVQYWGEAFEYLSEHGYDHSGWASKKLARNLFSGNDLSGWAEVTKVDGKLKIEKIEEPAIPDNSPIVFF